uniref:Mitochondrial transcription termination factor family protein n=1 Tax=Rhizophora mucronata TaxID=61149 RepID=A0A2P2LJG2_RHIMU
MIHLLCKSILYNGRFSIRTSPSQKWYLSHPQSSSLFSHRCFSSNANEPSFVVSYYMNKCGFSLESAISASKFVHFDSPDNPDAVVSFLMSHGFSEKQISKLIKKSPHLLTFNPGKTILPKLEFFYSKGASKLDVARICSGYTSILDRSLKNQIIPSFKYFRELLGSNEKVIMAVRRQPGIISLPLEYATGNVDALRKIGVPISNIASSIADRPSGLMRTTTRFNEMLQKVKEMGLNPLKCSFVFAVFVMGIMSETTWQRKIDAYCKWGFSKEEILMAFGKFPQFMTVSEDKIAAVMNVFVNQLGLEPAVIARNPIIVSLSLGKRIAPRASVAQALVSKGFLKKDFSLSGFFVVTEQLFLKRYIIPYEVKDFPLLKLYKEKLNSP